jgi:hypothetical protein
VEQQQRRPGPFVLRVVDDHFPGVKSPLDEHVALRTSLQRFPASGSIYMPQLLG